MAWMDLDQQCRYRDLLTIHYGVHTSGITLRVQKSSGSNVNTWTCLLTHLYVGGGNKYVQQTRSASPRVAWVLDWVRSPRWYELVFSHFSKFHLLGCQSTWIFWLNASPKFLIFQLLYQNLYQVQQKNTDEDCKLAVETLQESVKVCQSRSHCFTSMFHYSLHTHQPGKTFSLTASIVLFSDPLETTALIPHRIKSQSVWTPGSFVLIKHR